ncbi:MAG TPA: EAL domain-containing protein [Acidimicrobiales bacterium]|nr:EAL domain-containing protein [Acidimicrobiales bacterium]
MGTSAWRQPLRRRADRSRPGIWWLYAALAGVVLAYLVSLVIRPPDQQWTWLDGWGVAGFEAAAAGLCIVRGLTRRQGRSVPLLLGFGLLSWALGDFAFTAESLGGTVPPVPSVADLFYMGFYPLAYAGTMILLRRQVDRLSPPNWLDGAVAGLGAASLCAAFAFHDIARATRAGAAATATNLAYPVGDLLLLSLAIGGTALLARGRRGPWLVLAGGITVNVVGDTVNLFGATTVGQSHLGMVLNGGAWPVSILVISASAWMAPGTGDPLRPQRAAGFLLPGVAAGAGLILLFVGSLRPLGGVALGLATATLVVVGLRMTASVRSLRLLTEERHRQAVTDELTGLGNRRQLFHVLDAYFDPVATGPGELRAAGRTLAFLFIDLNRFKEINDSFGHPAGDELLRQIGPRLSRAVRPGDVVVRLGGDELGVVLLDAGADAATAAARRIVAALAEPFTLRMVRARIGASIGIALAPEDASDAAELLWCADVAMYRAKLGGTPFALYDHRIDGEEQQLRLVDELRAAVEAGDFVLHYQPQLDLRTGHIMAVEALVRWPHARLGLIPPLKFLPLAEEAGLMGDLTRLVLDRALDQCARWRREQPDLAVSVNVSASNLLDPDFTDLVGSLLDRHDVPPEALVLEITETSIITDFDRSRSVIERLRDLGIVVSIDDFGAGFTSLAYLSSLAVRELKLDRTFITGLGAGRTGRDFELVRATIELGHAMGLRVVAEGIEDAATLDLLGELGCDLAQGYFISRPMPPDELAFRPHGASTALAG